MVVANKANRRDSCGGRRRLTAGTRRRKSLPDAKRTYFPDALICLLAPRLRFGCTAPWPGSASRPYFPGTDGRAPMFMIWTCGAPLSATYKYWPVDESTKWSGDRPLGM
jgi:hypothetical protein